MNARDMVQEERSCSSGSTDNSAHRTNAKPMVGARLGGSHDGISLTLTRLVRRSQRQGS